MHLAEMLEKAVRRCAEWADIELPREFWVAVADSAIESLMLPLLIEIKQRQSSGERES